VPEISARFRLNWPGFTLDVDLRLPGRGVTAVFGQSGSGKTTLLRCIAGLERAPGGHLAVDGEVWQDAATFLPTHRRSLGYVFQEASLFPHMSVRRNLEYGIKRVPATSRRVSLDHAIALLGIGHLLERKPDRLSGGERQRVAITRALAVSPRLLLMDEPLAALDLARKQEILPYLERLHDELEIPVLYVSHSRDEVARLADHLVLLEAGRVLASGPLVDLLVSLELPLARGPQAESLVDAVVVGHDPEFHLTRVEFPGGAISLPREDRPTGARVRVRIRASDVSLARSRATDSSILNILPARVTGVGEAGPAQLLVQLALGDPPATRILARITRKSGAALGVAPGLPLYAQIKSVALEG
jgi:molybdate transport system ATP-binding protein